MTTTEIATIPLVPGTSIGDPSSPSASIMQETAATLRQQPGIQKIHFGPQVENPDVLHMLINWSTRQHHEAFMTSAAYGPFVSRLTPLLSAAPDLSHVDFQPLPALSRALSAPVTEIATFHFTTAPNADWLANAARAAEWLEREAGESRGLAYGVTHEEVEYQGIKGRAGVVVVGWTSREAHMAFRETEDFRENIGLLRGECEAVEMWHVAVMEAVE